MSTSRASDTADWMLRARDTVLYLYLYTGTTALWRDCAAPDRVRSSTTSLGGGTPVRKPGTYAPVVHLAAPPHIQSYFGAFIHEL